MDESDGYLDQKISSVKKRATSRLFVGWDNLDQFDLNCLGHITYEGNSTVDEGEPFAISCFLTLFDPVQWEKDGKPIIYEPGVTSAYSFHEETVDGKVMASLIVKSASRHHTGSYRCNTLSNESHHVYVVSGKREKA